jgi:hypothetical protein
MRDPFLSAFLPMLAAGLNQSGAEALTPCGCPPGACLGLDGDDEASNDPTFVIIIDTIGDIMSEPEMDAGAAGFDPDSFELTDEAQEELERQDDRAQVEHLGTIIDNMVHIVGMYTALIQDKVEG